MLQSDGSEVDAGRQSNADKALGATESPAVAGVDVWLWAEDKSGERRAADGTDPHHGVPLP